MNYLLLAATVKEINPFLNYYKKNIPAVSIDILITGIGLTSTAYHLTKQLQVKKYDLVIQAGVAGCFDRKIPLGKVMSINREAIADLSVVELKKLKTTFDLKLIPQNQFPYKKGWLINENKLIFQKLKIPSVRGVSVNEITTDQRKKIFYIEKFNPVVESMEGAALHFVCLMEKIPFIQLRSISNYIGERDKKKWNMSTSIENLNKELIQLLQ